MRQPPMRAHRPPPDSAHGRRLRARPFHGWFVVAAGFAVTFVGFGCAYTFGAFLGPLQASFGASRGSVSLVFSLAGFGYFALGAVSGPLADRIGARTVAAGGMLILAAGLALASWAQSLAGVYAAYGLGVGLGIGFSYVPAIGVVQRWFVRRRALASGLAVSGIGMGTLTLPPLAAFLIEHVTWRDAYRGLAAVALAGAIAALALRDRPEELGLAPDGEPVPAGISQRPHGAGLREALTSRTFAVLYLSCLVCGFSVFVPFVHLAPYAQDRGLSASAAAMLVGGIGLGSTVGRFALGAVADRLGRRASLITVLLGLAAAMALWRVAAGFWSLGVFAVVFGIFYGGWVAVLPALIMDEFGGRNVAGIIGLLYTSIAVGTLLGPAAAGYVFDSTGSYGATIVTACLANLLAALLAALTPRSAVIGSPPGA